MKAKDEEKEDYPGLAEHSKRFEGFFPDEKTKLLFSIAYKLGYDKAKGGEDEKDT